MSTFYRFRVIGIDELNLWGINSPMKVDTLMTGVFTNVLFPGEKASCLERESHNRFLFSLSKAFGFYGGLFNGNKPVRNSLLQ